MKKVLFFYILHFEIHFGIKISNYSQSYCWLLLFLLVGMENWMIFFLTAPTQTIYVGLSGGLNYSKLAYEDYSTEFLPSGQFSIDIEYPLVYRKGLEGVNTISSGIIYDNRNFNIIDTNNITSKINITYITFPVKYQYYLFSFDKENRFKTSFVIGPSFSLYISQSPSNTIEEPYWVNIGVILGSKFEYTLNPELLMFVEYNYQFGLTHLYDIERESRSVTQLINLGFKVPTSTIF